MPLTPGTTLGPYEIQAALGAGGMGEVYQARDTRLDRTVAIKVLPEHVAADPDLKQRFEREARTVAALNHPHICTLFDIGREGETDFLVLEYLEGETLAQRLKKGALPLDQALQIAIQIADALDKAHRQGIVHRDLKPGNIMLTTAGAKLLDFGLAKLRKPGTVGAEGFSAATTQSEPLTARGTLLGTLPYMAPEQLDGKDADARTDIFAFGSTIYEAATGRRAFEGKSQASLIGAILEREPALMSTLQPMTPPALDRVVKKCLEKDPEDRWHSAHDLTGELQWIAEERSGSGTAASTPSAQQPAGWRRVIPLTSAVVVGGLIAGLTVWSLTRPDPRMTTRFTVPLPTTMQLGPSRPLALSPDGRTLVYVARNETGVFSSRLYRRALEEPEATAIPGTENATAPFFSPDGARLGFFTLTAPGQGALKTVSLAAGTPVTLFEGTVTRSASWGPDDTIVLGANGEDWASLWQIPAAGGEPAPFTTVNLDEGEVFHVLPEFLPGGRAMLFVVAFGETGPYRDTAQIAVLSLDTGDRRILLQGSDVRYEPSGQLVFMRDGALWRVPFDAERLQVIGQPVPVMEPVAVRSGSADFAVGRSGTLAYRPSGPVVEPSRRLVWVDRDGNEEPLSAAPRYYAHPDVSPDGGRVAMVVTGNDGSDLWIYDLARNAPTRLTFGAASVTVPRWSPDGDRVVFSLIREGRRGPPNLFWRASDGTGEVERLTTSPNAQFASAWVRDGQRLLFHEVGDDQQADLWVLSLDEDEPSAEPLLQEAFDQRYARLSPDGRWMVYTSDESGQREVFVRPFPRLDDGKWQISFDGGDVPKWGPDGRELFYEGPTALMAVTIETEPTFARGSPEPLFDLEGYGRLPSGDWDLAPDGQRFLLIKERTASGDTAAAQIIVVQNWTADF